MPTKLCIYKLDLFVDFPKNWDGNLSPHTIPKVKP